MRSGWEVVPFEYWPPPPGKGFAAKHYSYYTTTAHYDIFPIMCTGIFGFTVHLLNVTLTLTSASVTTQLDTTCVWMFDCSKLTFSLWPERVRQHQESLRWVLGTFIFMFWTMVVPTVLGNFKWMLTLTNVKWVYMSQELRPSESEATKMLQEWSRNAFPLSYWTSSSSNHQ